MKMLRFLLGVTRMDKVRKAHLTMLGHVQWRDSGYTRQRMFQMELSRRREKKIFGFMDVVKED